MKIEHNTARIRHLLEMYRLGMPDFLEKISEDLKKPLSESDIFGATIQLSHLKRIDNVFRKGLHYYLDQSPAVTTRDASVFFRKEQFNADTLNIGSVRVVQDFEEKKHSLQAISTLSEIEFKRILDTYTVNSDPESIAETLRESLYPEFDRDRKTFLKRFIEKLAEFNILVFEFVENWNLKEKANIDGFYLKPNLIVLKRHSTYTREIFTLAHELAHYLLDEEEIDSLDDQQIGFRHENRIETWCNRFAFRFLAGHHAESLKDLDPAEPDNDYQRSIIDEISGKTHLSKLALYTHLLFNRRIHWHYYDTVKSELHEEYLRKQEEFEREKERNKELGIKPPGGPAKPIQSPLYISTIQQAYYSSVLDEYDVFRRLNIKPEI